MEYEIKQQDKFKFIEEGNGEPLVLLHGLFGALSNFKSLIEYFRQHNKVVVPILPLLDMDILHTSVGGLAKFVHRFIEARKYEGVHLFGNSLGGHVALLHVLKHLFKTGTLRLIFVRLRLLLKRKLLYFLRQISYFSNCRTDRYGIRNQTTG